MRRLFALLTAAPLLAAAGYTDHGQDLVPREHAAVEVSGAMRVRGEALDNLDLDRGVDPSGRPLFPVALGDPTAQTLTHADARLRTDLRAYAPGGLVAVKAQLDFFDNLALGSAPLAGAAGQTGVPAGTTGQRPIDLFRIRRAWGEALTPVGLVAAGRMGAQWGLGMLSHAGDCDDCDGGDSADRVAFITSMLGHLWAASYDIGAIGPTVSRPLGRSVDLDSAADVRTLSFAIMRWRDEDALLRRSTAGKSTFDYGLLVSRRTQQVDYPGWEIGSAPPAATQQVPRNFRALVADGWARVIGPSFRVEAEFAAMFATVGQATLVPGALLRDEVTATQFGAALESAFGPRDAPWRLGLDGGFASGDPAPGFGAFPTDNTRPAPGSIDGPQAFFPGDTRIDNFRFHPAYRVDRILFRELVGTVTDAVYLRPHANVELFRFASSRLVASAAAIASRAVFESSTPGGTAPLGVELDPSLAYESRDGFRAALDYAVLFPLSGLDNPALNLPARPAQLVRMRLVYGF